MPVLTLEQLLQKSGKPVWWKNKYNQSGWGIVSVQEYDKIIYIVPESSVPFVAAVYGEMNERLGLEIYDQEPGVIQNE